MKALCLIPSQNRSIKYVEQLGCTIKTYIKAYFSCMMEIHCDMEYHIIPVVEDNLTDENLIYNFEELYKGKSFTENQRGVKLFESLWNQLPGE